MKNQKLILVSLTAAMVIVVLGALLGTLLQKKSLELYNFDQVESGLSDGEVAQLETFLWESLQRTQGFDDSKSEIVALVRPSSFVKTTTDDITNYEFLVDIDEFKATYEVSFALVKGEGFYEAPMVDCPAPEQMKYPGAYCNGEKTSTMSVTVGRSLPYYFNLASGQLVTVTRGVSEGGDAGTAGAAASGEYLNVRVSSCGDAAVIDSARTEVEKWIKSLGYEPEKYQIKIPEFCDGAVN